MEVQALIELITGGSAAALSTGLLIWQLYRNKEITDKWVADLKEMNEATRAYALQLEKLTDTIERGQGGK